MIYGYSLQHIMLFLCTFSRALWGGGPVARSTIFDDVLAAGRRRR